MVHDEILTISELADLLKIAQKTVYTLSQRREIPAFKVGGQWRFSRAAIDAWIEMRTRASMGPEGAAGAPRAKGASARGRRR